MSLDAAHRESRSANTLSTWSKGSVGAPLLVDTRWIAPHGIGRFATEIIARLPEYEALPSGPKQLSLLDPFWTSYQISKLRPRAYFSPGFIVTIHASI